MEHTFEHHNKSCTIFLNKEDIEPETIKQIKKIMENPSISNIKIMPDCHPGTGCCIGFTSELIDKIVPNLIGGDIGCGIIVYPVANLIKRDKDIVKLEKAIKILVPMGNGHEQIHKKPIIEENQLQDFFSMAKETAVLFSEKYQIKFNIDISKYIPEYSIDYFKNLCETIGSNFKQDMCSLGTLGGGNHYIEVNQDVKSKDNIQYISVHSGSRNLGMKICQYYQNKIEDKSYLEGEFMYRYYFDMIFAQIYAKMNRLAILSLILTNYGHTLDSKSIIESIHNYIDFNDFIVRKGAIAAYKDNLCVVSLNMRDGILICEGKSNQNWNYSSAHGSGRLLSRNKAKNKLSLKEFKNSMKDVYSTSISLDIIDESPMAYKDTELIKKALEPTVDIKMHLLPLLNTKSI
jgi:tRNA-splicing ligase RtcB